MRSWIALLIAFSTFVTGRTALAQTSRDTTDVLRAVVSRLKQHDAHEDSVRARGCANGSDDLCRPALVPVWYVTGQSRVTRELATAQGNRLAADTLGGRQPPCAWPRDAAPAGAGFRTMSELHFPTPDSAIVILSHSCDNPPGYHHDVYMLGFQLWLRRESGRWKVVDFGIAVT